MSTSPLPKVIGPGTAPGPANRLRPASRQRNSRPAHSRARRIYGFGPYRLDREGRLLLRDGEPVALPPKAFDILLALVENGGRVLGKDELMQMIWPDTFVEQANLSVNIFLLRKALGQRSEGGQYIETVPRRGYRFASPVKETPGASPAGGRDFSLPNQAMDDDSLNLGFVMGWLSHLEYFREEPSFARLLSRLAMFSRLLKFDESDGGGQDAILDEIKELIAGARDGPLRTARDRVLATVLFAQLDEPESKESGQLDSLNSFREHSGKEIELFGGREGDLSENSLMATFDGPARAIRCACAISDIARRTGVRVSLGLHTGECDIVAGKLEGPAIDIASRVASKGSAAEVLVSRTVKDLVAGSGILFQDRGLHFFGDRRDAMDELRLFAVER